MSVKLLILISVNISASGIFGVKTVFVFFTKFFREFIAITLAVENYSFYNYLKLLVAAFYLLFRYLPFLIIKKIINFSK